MPNPIADILAHYGIKGQKWGVTRANPSSGSSGPEKTTVTATPGKRASATGGSGHSASADAIEAAHLKQKVKKSSTDALSNLELQKLTQRMNLEQQFSTMIDKGVFKSAGDKFLKKELGGMLFGTLKGSVNEGVQKQIKGALLKPKAGK